MQLSRVLAVFVTLFAATAFALPVPQDVPPCKLKWWTFRERTLTDIKAAALTSDESKPVMKASPNAPLQQYDVNNA
jgi:hypothetical protein